MNYQDTMTNEQHREGYIARGIERQTAKVPSDAFLWAAIGCMAGSATLQIMEKPHWGQFVGQWVPTLLILGLYNKLVKVMGSDFTERRMRERR